MAYWVPCKHSDNYKTYEFISRIYLKSMINHINSSPIETLLLQWRNSPITEEIPLILPVAHKYIENTTKLKNLRRKVPQNMARSEDVPRPLACCDGVFWHVNKSSWRARSAGLTPFQTLEYVKSLNIPSRDFPYNERYK